MRCWRRGRTWSSGPGPARGRDARQPAGAAVRAYLDLLQSGTAATCSPVMRCRPQHPRSPPADREPAAPDQAPPTARHPAHQIPPDGPHTRAAPAPGERQPRQRSGRQRVRIPALGPAWPRCHHHHPLVHLPGRPNPRQATVRHPRRIRPRPGRRRPATPAPDVLTALTPRTAAPTLPPPPPPPTPPQLPPHPYSTPSPTPTTRPTPPTPNYPHPRRPRIIIVCHHLHLKATPGT